MGIHTALKPQYNRLIRHSIGALATLIAFLTWKRVWFMVISARRPTINEIVANDRPMMVKYCKCHPYESLLMVCSCQSHITNLEEACHTLDSGSVPARRRSRRMKPRRSTTDRQRLSSTSLLEGLKHVKNCRCASRWRGQPL